MVSRFSSPMSSLMPRGGSSDMRLALFAMQPSSLEPLVGRLKLPLVFNATQRHLAADLLGFPDRALAVKKVKARSDHDCSSRDGPARRQVTEDQKPKHGD